jgi:hypothetical protein
MSPQTRVKERAAEQASAMSTDQQSAIRSWSWCAPPATTAATETGATC